MLSFADRKMDISARKDDGGVKRVVFDLDGVLISEKASWGMIKRRHGIAETYGLFMRGRISLGETLGFMEAEARVAGLRRSDFIDAAREVPLQEHAKEVVLELHRRGIGLDIATFSPTIYAKAVAERIHPEAFLRRVIAFGPMPMNVYGRTVVFDSEGRYVSTFAYPNGAGEAWENLRDLNKKIIIDTIAKRHGLKGENILFVSDGGDTEASHYYPTIGFRHDGNSMRTIAEISDLRELLMFV